MKDNYQATRTSTGKGRTFQSAVEHALSAAKLPPPYKFEILTIGGNCSVETELFFEVRVKLTQEETLEQTAERRSVGKPCELCNDTRRYETVGGELADCEKCRGGE
jgi:hypothetical protein